MRRVMIVLAATTLLAAGAAAQDRGQLRDDFGARGTRDQLAGGDFGSGFDRPGMGRGMMGMMGMGRFTPEDIEAFTDARIAALRAGLKLTAEQEKLWPPIEQAIRDLVKLRREQARAFRDRSGDNRDDLPGMLRGMADRQAARSDALRKLADAATPLYASFDDGQKRRLRVLIRQMRPHGMMRHAMRGMGHGGMDGMGHHGMGGMGRGMGRRDIEE